MSETVTIYKSLAQVTRLRHPLITPMSVYDNLLAELKTTAKRFYVDSSMQFDHTALSCAIFSFM